MEPPLAAEFHAWPVEERHGLEKRRLEAELRRQRRLFLKTARFALGAAETILAVEDNPGLRNLVVRQLKQLGYNCLEAEDGPSALKMLETHDVDLLFSDVIMPGGMSGYELGHIARTRWPQIKVLPTSGFPEEKINGNGKPPWNMRLLLKPHRKEDLALMLREVLAEEAD